MIPPVLPTYTRAPLAFERGEGAWLTERDGRRFLDMGAGIAVNVLGHAHPALTEALTAQALAAGVFGAPSYVLPDGEIFWGQDRLGLLDWRLSRS